MTVAKKRPHANDDGDVATVLTDFAVAVVHTAKSTYCWSCHQWIPKDKMGIKKIVDKIGALWYDVTCFAKHRSNLGWNAPVDSIPGFNQLSAVNKNLMKKLFV